MYIIQILPALMVYPCWFNIFYMPLYLDVSAIFLLSVLITPGQPAGSCQGSGISAEDVRLWSGETEVVESLSVSQQMIESLLLGAGMQLENEEYLMSISVRLQAALEKMLMAITDTTNQVWTSATLYSEYCLATSRHLLSFPFVTKLHYVVWLPGNILFFSNIVLYFCKQVHTTLNKLRMCYFALDSFSFSN